VAKESTCQRCGRLTPAYDLLHIINLDGLTSILCAPCVNATHLESSASGGQPIPEFEPYVLKGKNKRRHTFHIRGRYGPAGITLEAFELIKGERAGYEFAVLFDNNADILAEYAKLIRKIRLGTAVRHIQRSEYGPSIDLDTGVAGRIAWDERFDGEIPLLIVDGKPYSWEAVGRMLMTFEGFNFRLTIHDPTDEV